MPQEDTSPTPEQGQLAAITAELLSKQVVLVSPFTASGANTLVGQEIEQQWRVVQELPPKCQSFATDRDLANEIKLATELAKTIFPFSTSISFSLEHDPEVTDSWIEIRVATQGTTSDLLRGSKKFSAEWVSHTLPTKRYLIRLSLDAV